MDMPTVSLEKELQELIGKKYSPACEKFEKVIAGISKNLSGVYQLDGFFELDVDTVCKVLSDDNLQVADEVEVFRVGLKWIAHIKEERAEYISRVMGCVRFQHMTQKELIECLSITNTGKQSSREVYRRVNWCVTAAIVESSQDTLNVQKAGARKCLRNKGQKTAWQFFFSIHTDMFGVEEGKYYGKDEGKYYRKDEEVEVKDQTETETSFCSRLRNLLCCFARKNRTEKTFGSSLENLMGRAPNGAKVPQIVTRLCGYFNKRGFEDVGIFRVNGNQKVINRLKNKFDKHGDVDIGKEKDFKAIAGLLKLFLRELKDPVIPEDLTEEFVRIEKGHKQSTATYIFKMRQALGKLPHHNYELIKHIIGFLGPVAEKEAVNKMGPKQLGIVFGPNIFRCGEGLEGLENLIHYNDVVCGLIKNNTAIFGDDNAHTKSTGKVTPSRNDSRPPKKHPLLKDRSITKHWNDLIEELKRRQGKRVRPVDKD